MSRDQQHESCARYLLLHMILDSHYDARWQHHRISVMLSSTLVLLHSAPEGSAFRSHELQTNLKARPSVPFSWARPVDAPKQSAQPVPELMPRQQLHPSLPQPNKSSCNCHLRLPEPLAASLLLLLQPHELQPQHALCYCLLSRQLYSEHGRNDAASASSLR